MQSGLRHVWCLGCATLSEEKPHYIEKLPVGEYTLREVTAPDGYEVAEDVKFTVAETGDIQHVVMKDKPKETPTTPKTGDDRNPLIWLLLLGLGGGLAGAAWYLRKKDKVEQNQD